MIEHHQQQIAKCEVDIRDMEAGELRHYSEGPDGRLSQDTTAYMLAVAAQSERMHERCLALYGAVTNPTACD